MKTLLLTAVLAVCLIPLAMDANAQSDLDDGIKIDDSIRGYDNLNETVTVNKTFIKLRAKSKARVKGETKREGAEDYIEDMDFIGMGNVVVGEGTDVYGDVIIVIEGDNEVIGVNE